MQGNLGRTANVNIFFSLDIHWVWHCHMLCPTLYHKDLAASSLGRPINHRPRDLAKLKELREITGREWARLYPEEPFDHKQLEYVKMTSEQLETKFEYDIAEAVSRQRMFYYQVSLPHYRTKAFLEEAVVRYKMYLRLKQLNPGKFLVPCYDMDIVWHTHQVQIKSYFPT